MHVSYYFTLYYLKNYKFFYCNSLGLQKIQFAEIIKKSVLLYIVKFIVE